MRMEWVNFKNKSKPNKKIFVPTEQINEVFTKMFG